LFGLLLTDLFSGSPFVVELEADLSVQQQLLDVVIVRRGRGRFSGRLPDGLEGLGAHILITFKSHREALDSWAMKELVGHYVAYRKLVSRAPSDLLAEDQFRLYTVTARYPHKLSDQVPWQRVQAGVYDFQWGTDTIRSAACGGVICHLSFVICFGPPVREGPRHAGTNDKRRMTNDSGLLVQLFERFQTERFAVPYTMEDFKRDYVKEHFPQLTPEEQAEVLQTLPPEKRLAGLSAEQRLAGLSEEQIRHYLERLSAARSAAPRKPRRKT
jgi:hypothetical protein